MSKHNATWLDTLSILAIFVAFALALVLLMRIATAWALPALVGSTSVQRITTAPPLFASDFGYDGAIPYATFRLSITTSTAIYDPPGNLCVVVYPYNRYGEGTTAGLDFVNLRLAGRQSFSETLQLTNGELFVFSATPNFPYPGCQPQSIPGPYDYSVVLEKLE